MTFAQQMERELADLETKVGGLGPQLPNLPPALRANAKVELARIRGKLTELRERLDW